jgi:DHA1 family multidrug resistance protein-like MFS transporter
VSFNFLCAFTSNFAGLLIGRFLTGTFAASALSNAPGLIADIWGPVERGNAMILFIVATFAGPALGPITAGFLELKMTWRWTFYVLLGLAGVTEILLLTLPETLPSAVLQNNAKRMRRQNSSYGHILAPTEVERRGLVSLFNTAWTRPWRILVDPISFLIAIFYSVVYTLLYMLFNIYPIVFQQQRGWNVGIGELPLLGVVVGACLGGILLYLLNIRNKNKIESGHRMTPEDRLPAAMVGGALFPVTMFWFAWTAEFNTVHWLVPTIAGTFLATSILLIFVGFINYLVDVYINYAASAVAANTVIRSACGAAAPLFTQYMFNALGVGVGGSLIGGVAVLLAPIPFLFYWYGESIRRRSSFATTTADEENVIEDEKEVVNEK